MKPLRSVVLFCVAACAAGTAWAQLGLYGSPEMLNYSQLGHQAPYYGPYHSPQAYPIAQPAPQVPTTPRTAYVPPMQQPAYHPTPGGRPSPIPAEPAPPQPPLMPTQAPARPVAGPTPSVVQQMLDEAAVQATPTSGPEMDSNGGGIGPDLSSAAQDAPYSGPVNSFEQAAWGGWTGGWASPWYASVHALIMGRNLANRVWTTYEWGNEANQTGNTQVELEWRWGGEVRFGRWFCCRQWAVEAVYWTLEPFERFVSFTHPARVGTPLTVGNVLFGANPGTDFFDDSEGHRLWRRNELHNVEVNLVRNPALFASAMPWDVDWSLGMRWFHFEENLIFAGVAGGFVWGQDPTSEAYLNDLITNDLLGFQFGFDASYYRYANWRIFVAPRFGIYGNHIDHVFRAYRGDGVVASPDPVSGVVGTYPVRSSKDTVSFLTQVDLGVEWAFARGWTARAGYRLLAVTGMGLADNQIPPYIVDIPEIADIDVNGELILHGGYFGVTWNF